MRSTSIFAVALLALPALALTALAQPQEGRGRGPGCGQPNIGFSALDTNGDGVLDAQEIAAAPAVLATLDKNSDGRITSDEVRPQMAGGRGEGRGGGRGEGRGEEDNAAANVAEDTVKTLMAFDANGDGKLSRAELPERFQGLFDRADANHDGFLTPDEIRKMAAAQAPPPESQNRGGRGGDESERGGRGGGEGGRGEGGRGRGPGGDMNFIRIDPILSAIDANGDGIIDAEEIRNAPAAIRKLDKDGDGKITREEARNQQ